jgi:hypothetical protein
MLICSRTGRVLETVTIRGNMRVRCGRDVHEVAFDDVEAVWPLV